MQRFSGFLQTGFVTGQSGWSDLTFVPFKVHFVGEAPMCLNIIILITAVQTYHYAPFLVIDRSISHHLLQSFSITSTRWVGFDVFLQLLSEHEQPGLKRFSSCQLVASPIKHLLVQLIHPTVVLLFFEPYLPRRWKSWTSVNFIAPNRWRLAELQQVWKKGYVTSTIRAAFHSKTGCYVIRSDISHHRGWPDILQLCCRNRRSNKGLSAINAESLCFRRHARLSLRCFQFLLFQDLTSFSFNQTGHIFPKLGTKVKRLLVSKQKLFTDDNGTTV